MNTKKLWAELRRSWVFNHKRHHEYIQTIPGAQNLDAPWKWVVKGSFWTSTLWDLPSRNPSLEALRNRQSGFTRILSTPWLLNLSWELGSPMSLPGFPGGTRGKESTCQYRRHKRHGFNPWAGKIPRRKAWQTTPVSLPGESHQQRSLAGYSSQGCKELDMTEWLSTIIFTASAAWEALAPTWNVCLSLW